MMVWFATPATLGIWHISERPGILWALSPVPAVNFFLRHGLHGFLILGSVVLVVTGSEALYADLGHFGAAPICRAWLWLVFPALLLGYLGQGALVLARSETSDNPFFAQVPAGPATIALVLLSGAATVIASQALISGAFSLTLLRASPPLIHGKILGRGSPEQALGSPPTRWLALFRDPSEFELSLDAALTNLALAREPAMAP
jgi:K+ transporter